ncbi:uncharacterized protein METZ01_LOCUS307284, partial [marine metagenome]
MRRNPHNLLVIKSSIKQKIWHPVYQSMSGFLLSLKIFK